MYIKKKALSDFLTLAHIKPYNYNLDNKLENNKDEDTIVLLLSPFSNISCFPTFVSLARNTNEISC